MQMVRHLDSSEQKGQCQGSKGEFVSCTVVSCTVKEQVQVQALYSSLQGGWCRWWPINILVPRRLIEMHFMMMMMTMMMMMMNIMKMMMMI